VTQALRLQDKSLIKGLCALYEARPRTTTKRRFSAQGIALGDPLHESAVIFGAMRGREPIVVKKLVGVDEVVGYQGIYQFKAEQLAHCLAPFDMFEAKSPVAPSSIAVASSASASSEGLDTGVRPQSATLSRTPIKTSVGATFSVASSSPLSSHVLWNWVAMTRYVQTLDQCPRPLARDCAGLLIHRMLKALNFLHDKNLAHMDIKPSNIMIDMAGLYWLADFGSVRPINTPTSSLTLAFVPTDFRTKTYVAVAALDHWMLGVTVVDMLSERREEEVGAGATDLDTKKVLEELYKLDDDNARQFISILLGARAQPGGG
jgi:hypothetical protein